MNIPALVAFLLAEEEANIKIQTQLGGKHTIPEPPPAGDPIGDALRTMCLAYWKMDEVELPLIDSSGGNHTLILYNHNMFLPVVGIVNGGFGYIDSTLIYGKIFSDIIGVFTEWSWSGWIKISTSFGATEVSTLADLPNQVYVVIDGDNGLYIEAGIVGTTFPLSPGVWHNIIVVSDSINHNLYIDGVLKETIINARTPASFSEELMLTAGWNDVDYYQMDEIGIFNMQITAEQIAYLYNTGAGRTLYP